MNTYSGKTIDEAIKQACIDKNITTEELTYTIEEEKKGIFGLGNSVTIKAYCQNDICIFIKEYLENYLVGVNNFGEVSVSETDNFFKTVINAENNGILIGKNGQTLQSINVIVKTAVSAKFKRRVRLLVDVNGYKDEKYIKEINLAKRVAKTVQRTKTSATLDPMPADERKAIHAALTNFEHIKTISEGEGAQRRLTIKYVE